MSDLELDLVVNAIQKILIKNGKKKTVTLSENLHFSSTVVIASLDVRIKHKNNMYLNSFPENV